MAVSIQSTFTHYARLTLSTVCSITFISQQHLPILKEYIYTSQIHNQNNFYNHFNQQ